MFPTISKLNIEIIHEDRNYTVFLYDAADDTNPDVKKITIAGKKYVYEEDSEAPGCVKNLLKSLSEDHPFSKKKELISFISQMTNINQMSLTKSVYTIGENKLLKRTNADTDQLTQEKNSLCQILTRCKPNDTQEILAIINKAEPFLRQPKIAFEIADQIEKNGNPELAHTLREVMRSFDLQSTIERLPELIAGHYLDPHKGEMIAERLKSAFNSGKYERFYDRIEFINELTIELREIINDKHLAIVDRQAKNPKSENGTVKVELNKDFSYFELTKFENPNEVIDEKLSALQEVKHALDQIKQSNPKAIIIDLRRNDGGSLYTMAYIASHFIKPSQDLGQNIYRDKITEQELQTFPVEPIKTLSEEELPLKERMLEQPIFILTSNYSFSAAEALACHLREYRKAALVGEITRGGAHVCKLFEVNNDFFVGISFGEYTLKSGEKNWEGNGLIPNTLTNAVDARRLAEEQIRER